MRFSKFLQPIFILGVSGATSSRIEKSPYDSEVKLIDNSSKMTIQVNSEINSASELSHTFCENRSKGMYGMELEVGNNYFLFRPFYSAKALTGASLNEN